MIKIDSKFVVLLLLLFVGCSNNSDYLDVALKQAGENRAELERVLDYYKKDSPDALKLKAAVF